MSVIFKQFEQVASQFPSKLAIATLHQEITYNALLTLSNHFVTVITQASLPANSRPRVAMVSDNSIAITAISLACAKLNACCIPCNPQLTANQLSTAWQNTDASIILTDADFLTKSNQANHKQLPLCEINSLDFNHQRKNVEDIIPEAKIEQWRLENDFIITLSSGSTGAPKPICLSQKNKLLRAQQSWDLYNVSAQDVVLSASPFFHSLGQRLTFVPLLRGATMVHLQPFTPKNWLFLIEKYKVSFVISVSSHLYALKDALLTNTEQVQSLRCIVTSSAPIDASFKEQLFNQIGCHFHEMYGATEIATASNLTPDNAKLHHQSVGIPCSGINIKILDDDYKEQPRQVIGEIAVKSPLVFTGYYQQAELTQSSFNNDYFLTGDLGKIDDDGFLHYIARKKDVIISGGINIYPNDIEQVILQHPMVNEVAVIGVNDPFLGEVIIAVCVGSPEPKTLAELSRLALKELAPFQRPLTYFFVDKLPTTASGKMSKQMLRDQYNQLDKDWSAPLRMMFYR